jgi:hypothetical protein
MNSGVRSLRHGFENFDERAIWIVLVLFLMGAAVCPHDPAQNPATEIRPMNATRTTMESSSDQEQTLMEPLTGPAEAPSHLETATFALG